MIEDDTHDHATPESDEAIDLADVQGHNFDGAFNFGEFLGAYATTGLQAMQLVEVVDIAEEMQETDTAICLTFTPNIVSSGLREAVTYPVREGFVDVLAATSGSLTEDVIKTAKPFRMGSQDAGEGELRERGINRLGNIYVPSDRYVQLEQYLCDFFEDFFAEEKVRTPTTFAHELGAILGDEHSMLKQATDNDVSIHCPALTDTEVGNFLYYCRQDYDKEASIEILDNYNSLIQDGLLADETGLTAVGGGVPKHHAIMANLFRDGADCIIYISAGVEGDGSLSDTPPNEIVSWRKIKDHDMNYTQVETKATPAFPLLVANTLKS